MAQEDELRARDSVGRLEHDGYITRAEDKSLGFTDDGLAQAEARIFYYAYWRRCWLPARSPDTIGAALRAAGRLPRSARALQVPPRHRGLRLVTRGSVAAAHAAGLAVHVWTIDEPLEMGRLLALGVDGIVSNRPAVARKVIDGTLQVSRDAGGG